MYDNIASLKFVRSAANELVVTALVSAEGEEMALVKNVLAVGRVEDWMKTVLLEMRVANRLITKHAIFYYCADNKTRLEWMMMYQV
jgi:dynein heavy chain, axonemal